jgi:hypothetical protein
MNATLTPRLQDTTAPRIPDVSLPTLQALMADLQRAYPHAGARVDHAAFLVLARRVERGLGAGWWVGSELTPEAEYLVLPEQGTCTCQDHARHGALSPCKHRLAVELLQRCERLEAESTDPTLRPIAYALTPQALARLDDHRQRLAARCPTCGEWKQHGDLFCGGRQCEQASA